MQPELDKAAQKIAGLFGKRIVFTKSDRADCNGVTLKKTNPGVIYINVDNEHLPLTVLGHELAHTLSVDHPALYKTLKTALTAPNVLKRSGLQDFAASYLKKVGGDRLTNDFITEEMIGDFIGDNFADPSFWSAMERHQPSLFCTDDPGGFRFHQKGGGEDQRRGAQPAISSILQ